MAAVSRLSGASELATVPAPDTATSVAAAPGRSAPYSIWRRLVLAEAAQVELDLNEARITGPPYSDLAGYDFGSYLDAAVAEVASARQATASEWPRNPLRRLSPSLHELVRVWTGSAHETAVAALHRAEGLYLMIASHDRVRAETLKIESIFTSSTEIPMTDPRHGAFADLFARIKASSRGAIDVGDRLLLREVRRQQNEAWEIARSRVRIFRNILTGTIPFLTAVLLVAAFIGWVRPTLVPLVMGAGVKPGPADVATVEFLGALGGLLSSVATIRAARNFQRFYGLPLAQSILKLPAGAASALAGILLVQHGLLGSIGPFTRDTMFAYALIFGVAQIAVTKQIDTRAGDLLGEANAKSPSTAQSTSASRGGSDA